VLVKRVLFLFNAAFVIANLDLISQVQLASFGKMLPKYFLYIKIKQFRYRPGVAQRVPGNECSQIS
jgi:hypothetical protein